MTQKQRTEKIKDFLTELNKTNCKQIDLPYFADGIETSFEELRDNIDNGGGFDVEIIYYSSAIEYLMNNDNSLRESLAIAADMGFDIKNLSSEILASLLATQNEREEFEGLESEIETFFEELNQEEESEEEEEI